jgi:shikimate dehydrogenase
MPTITGKTKLLGVIGDPIGHSLSPVMHNAAIAEMGWDYVYVPFPVKDLATALAGFSAIGVVGFNITLPHKQAIMPLLTEITDLAQAVGAVNTVWQTDAGWHGTNTDVAGFIAPLQALGRDWSQTTAICLGNGGAARAVVAGCAQLGCREIQVIGRKAENLAAFQASWQGSPLAGNLTVHPWTSLGQLLPAAGLVVNATPIGMSPQPKISPLSSTEAAAIAPHAIAYDLIYGAVPSRFCADAQALGATALDGFEMLVQQGAAALAIWTGEAVPVGTMRRALEDYLQGCRSARSGEG